MEDVEIARNCKLNNIIDITNKLNIDEKYVDLYGKYKAKISNNLYDDLKEKEDR